MLDAQLTLAICTSVSFYKEVIELSSHLESMGIIPKLPGTAENMKHGQVINDEAAIDWTDSTNQHLKAGFIRAHFEVIADSDAILVANYTKHGQPDYIGPNVLMEMAVAFHLNKPIYPLNGIPSQSPLLDEVLGLCPIPLKGDLSLIATLLKEAV